MEFLPHAQVLPLEELYPVAATFTHLGVHKIRLTGGEPLVRRGILTPIERLDQLPVGLDLTTNGTQLPKMAKDLARSGIDRLNISLDSLQPERFRTLTRKGQLDQVLEGVLKGRNHDEVLDLVRFARNSKLEISLIEEMPWSNIGAWWNRYRSCGPEYTALWINHERTRAHGTPTIRPRRNCAQTMEVSNSPNPSIQTFKVSPDFRNTPFSVPTPAGVPVRIISPGSSSSCLLRYEICSAML